ncbi:MAG: 6-phosphogluconolactonase [Bacteroidetes bacterium ADurb.Bin141]|nr:MAG: 6-phosphogluconolactonase [Bacteroidetes bacterium ADurb.Bin141]
MDIKELKHLLPATLLCLSITSCTWDKMDDAAQDDPCLKYPPAVEAIITTKCATAGCHNSISNSASSGLDLTNWKTMREGNDAGAVVIPGNADYSTLFSFSNTFSDLGFSGNEPKMPYERAALSHDEMQTIKDWIMGGAKNACGEDMFPQDDNRKKIYVSNQACDQVVVLDQETRLIMKWFDVGDVSGITEAPHMIKVTPDKKYFLIAFFSSGVIQRYRTSDDSFVDQVDCSNGISGQWGTLTITPDGKRAYSVDWSAAGRIAVINLENFPMTSFTSLPITALAYPHGMTFNSTGDKLYITNQNGGTYYIADTIGSPADFPQWISNLQTLSYGGGLNGHEIIFSPDNSKYFVSCDATNEVRVFDATTNALLKVIPVGTLPQEFSLSHKFPYLFVTCTEDIINGNRGSVSIIDYNNLTLIKKIHTGTQPHGIAVDDEKDVVYVANRNVDANGEAPHHSGACAGRNGNMTIIDMNTLELVPGYKCELGVEPYSVALKD